MPLKPLLVISSVILSIPCFSNTVQGQDNLLIAKGRVFTDDGQRANVFNITIGENTVRYQIKAGGNYTETPIQKVLQVQKQTGNEAVIWGASLGAAALLGSLLGVASAEAQYSGQPGSSNPENKAAVPVVIGSTVVGALIGILIGSGEKKYKTVYADHKLMSLLLRKINFHASLN